MWETPDIEDDDLPADDAPPEAEMFSTTDPKTIPPDVGNLHAESKWLGGEVAKDE